MYQRKTLTPPPGGQSTGERSLDLLHLRNFWEKNSNNDVIFLSYKTFLHRRQNKPYVLNNSMRESDDLSRPEGADCTYSPARGAGRALPFTFMRILSFPPPCTPHQGQCSACILSEMLDVFLKWNEL